MPQPGRFLGMTLHFDIDLLLCRLPMSTVLQQLLGLLNSTGAKLLWEANVDGSEKRWNKSSHSVWFQERKFPGAKDPRNESSQERMFQERKYRRAKRQ